MFKKSIDPSGRAVLVPFNNDMNSSIISSSAVRNKKTSDKNLFGYAVEAEKKGQGASASLSSQPSNSHRPY